MGQGRLRAWVTYTRKVYDLPQRLAAVQDQRRAPRVTAPQVAAAILFTGLLRIRSLNALEPKLREKPFLRLVDAPIEVRALCSADTLSRALRGMDLEKLRAISVGVLRQAERNKVFREGWHGALRYAAVDAWETISSYHPHCPECLVRVQRFKGRDGSYYEVEQYYHRYVVAMLIDRRCDLLLDFEPLLPQALRPIPSPDGRDEGELTAAHRLLRRVKATYPWIDVVVGDGLYANGPFLTLAKELGLGAVVVARKEGDEPLKEALELWGNQPPEKILTQEGERIELWDCRDLQTLDTYSGPIRVVQGRVQDLKSPEAAAHTWCMLVTGVATRLSADRVLAVARGRWHIENTGFHQWMTHWHFGHVFVHDAQGIQAVYWLFFVAFNLLTLFLYLQVRSYGRDRGSDPTRTIRRLIDEMRDDLARLDCSPWNTS